MKKKSFIVMAMCLVLCFAMSAVCFASGELNGFVSDINAGITADAMWGGVRPFAPLMITIFLFAFAYGIFRRVTKAGSKGKYRG